MLRLGGFGTRVAQPSIAASRAFRNVQQIRQVHRTHLRAQQLAFAVISCLILAALPGAVCATAGSDKAALLGFKDGLQQTGGLLDTWEVQSDPCEGKWLGVSCTCDAPVPLSSCDSNTSPPRVLQLSISGPEGPPQQQARFPQLEGPISPVLGDLTALRVLSLPHHLLEGTVPASLAQLTQLQVVNLSDNELIGFLPRWAGALPHGVSVRLDNNNFSGPVPSAWCPQTATADYNISITNNDGLCSTIPECVHDRIPSVAGTGIISQSLVGSAGRLCSDHQEDCSAQGCRVLLKKYNTNLTSIYFAFTEFGLANMSTRQLPVSYIWGLGTEPNSDNVLTANPVDRNINYTGVVPTQSGRNETVLLYPVELTLNGVAFINNYSYYVTVTALAVNDTTLTANLTSSAIITDVDPPYLPSSSAVSNTGGYYSEQSTTITDIMSGSWDDFIDPESGILFYQFMVQKITKDPNVQGQPSQYQNITALENVGLNTTATARGLNLEKGCKYVILVNATNGAHLTAAEHSSPLLIVSKGETVTSSSAAIIASAVIGICGVIIALITVYIVRSRYNARLQTRRQQRRQMKEFKGLMYGLVSSDTGGDPLQKNLDRIVDCRELCFVTTDLEGSTAQASADNHAFLQVQDVHDTVMREGIAKHGGYEINTEGDAFQVAFITVPQAVLFCQETQYRLLESVWPREVLKLPSCGEVLDEEKTPVFRGPRVRMGINWASEGSFTNRLHAMTKHRVFSGPGFQLAQKIGDIACGGQVIMTHQTWLQLYKHMDQAGFPTVESLGMYKLDEWPKPEWLYQVSHLLGKPLSRTFEPLRRAERLLPAQGFAIVPPPQPRRIYGTLTICVVRLALDELHLQLADDDADEATLELPALLSQMLWEVVAVDAMQFKGYIFHRDDKQGYYMIAFANTLDAVRCGHAIQASLMCIQWPPETMSFSGATYQMPDGRPIFRGPRMATAIHETVEYTITDINGAVVDPQDTAAFFNLGKPLSYAGGGEAFTRQVCSAAFGGQVILTESAWSTVQDHIPGQAQVVSLGVHVISRDGNASKVLLMEVMPSALARRTFPPPKNTYQVEPGYRDSPDPNQHLALLYFKTSKPREVAEVEELVDTMADDLVSDTLTDYNLGLMMIGRAVRALLKVYGGYECKEPEMGKFTLAFRSLEAAVRWAVAIQEDLLDLSWPDAVLEWSSAATVPGPEGRPLWRGLRAGIGIAWGGSTYRKPLNTGRADYFGNLPNLAARLSSMAAPGQILLHSNGLGIEPAVSLPEHSQSIIMLPPLSGVSQEVLEHISRGSSQRGIFSSAYSVLPSQAPPAFGTLGPPLVSSRRADSDVDVNGTSPAGTGGGDFGGLGTVQLSCLGYFMIKGIEKPQVVWQARPQRLMARKFPLPHNRISDRSRFLVEVHRRGTSSRAARCSSFNTAGNKSSSTEAGKLLSHLRRKGRRFTTGSLFPRFHRGGDHSDKSLETSAATGVAPPTSSSDSFAEWPTLTGSRHASMTTRQDSVPSRLSSETHSEMGPGVPQHRSPPTYTGPNDSAMRQSSGTIEQGVWWGDAQAVGFHSKPDHDDERTGDESSYWCSLNPTAICGFGCGHTTQPRPERKPSRPANSSSRLVSRSEPVELTEPSGSSNAPSLRLWRGGSGRFRRNKSVPLGHGEPNSAPAGPAKPTGPPGPSQPARPAREPARQPSTSARMPAGNSTAQPQPTLDSDGPSPGSAARSPFAERTQQQQQQQRKEDSGSLSANLSGSQGLLQSQTSLGSTPKPATTPDSAALRSGSSPTGRPSPPASTASAEPTVNPLFARNLSTSLPCMTSDAYGNGMQGSRVATGDSSNTDLSGALPLSETISDFNALSRGGSSSDTSVTPDNALGGTVGPSVSLPTAASSDLRLQYLQRSPSMGVHARELAQTFIARARPKTVSREPTSQDNISTDQSFDMRPRTDSGHLSQEELAELRAMSSSAYDPSTGRRAVFRQFPQL